jgi:hypothetical protein
VKSAPFVSGDSSDQKRHFSPVAETISAINGLHLCEDQSFIHPCIHADDLQGRVLKMEFRDRLKGATEIDQPLLFL